MLRSVRTFFLVISRCLEVIYSFLRNNFSQSNCEMLKECRSDAPRVNDPSAHEECQAYLRCSGDYGSPSFAGTKQVAFNDWDLV